MHIILYVLLTNANESVYIIFFMQTLQSFSSNATDLYFSCRARNSQPGVRTAVLFLWPNKCSEYCSCVTLWNSIWRNPMPPHGTFQTDDITHIWFQKKIILSFLSVWSFLFFNYIVFLRHCFAAILRQLNSIPCFTRFSAGSWPCLSAAALWS